MYKNELIEQDKIIESKEFLKFDDIFTYSSILLKELTLNSKVVIFEKKEEKWVEFGKWQMK